MFLAPWPIGCVRADPRTELDPRALAMLPPEVAGRVRAQLGPDDGMRTSAGDVLVALDRLLVR